MIFVRSIGRATPLENTQESATAPASHYVGSAACKNCHADIYERWKKTRMANVVRDPHEHPDAIIPGPRQTRSAGHVHEGDIAFVYGSKWKQRYFTKVGDDYFPLPAQWDVSTQDVAPYFVANGTDWWAPFYPADNMQRPTGPLCDGCHSVNYDIETKRSPNGTSAARSATAPAARTSAHPRAPIS